ncbi:MAG: RdgB/HAM1 family non-canonical purine NTP pyrophosphatase [Sandaracinaceae bacterium]|nr:RdgB/HAM1 family non-canonical purine NTP pyrophosphatase [Sandaracinaceae bacterium]
MQLVVATKNKGKLLELRQLLDVPGLELVGVDQRGVALPDVEESGDTYEANALLKARAIAALTGGLVLADDSGLEVDALGGAPGVRSARYAGDAGARANTEKLLAAMADVPDGSRTARFRCVIVVVRASRNDAVIVSGRCEGAIAGAMRGSGGFGYDPVFEVAPHELATLGRVTSHERLTMAELDEGEKNLLSHRGRAVAALRARWSEVEALAC